MSKAGNAFFILNFAVLCVALSASNSYSQDIEAIIKVNAKTNSLSVNGKTLASGKNLSFLNSALGANELATRVSGLELKDKDGKHVALKKFNTGEFVSEADFVGWSYEVNIALPKDPRASAHVSWLADKTGLLMLDDILPQFSNAGQKVFATVKIEVPDGWKVVSSEKNNGQGTFNTGNIEKAVFVIGTDVRETKLQIRSSVLNVAAAGQWLFTDAESAYTAETIYKEYFGIFGSSPADNLQIVVVPFPQNGVQKGTWEAETRGTSVIIVSADMPFKTQSLQRLHEQMRHEIFHLWLPNGVNLSGNYDWFYEGFALYRSLKMGVALNQIRFEDYLDTLSRAYNIGALQTRPLSLIEASQNRWNGADTQVYARGMLAAFLCDLSLLEGSKRKTSVDDIFRTLYSLHRPPNTATDANTAVLKVLSGYPQLAGVVENYIKGRIPIDWRQQLETAGIENEPESPRANLRVKVKLTGNQKVLLDKLGYNNWRKLTGK